MGMARIYYFPDFQIEENEIERAYTDEEIERQYREYYEWEENEYLYNQLMKQQKAQKKEPVSHTSSLRKSFRYLTK